MKVAARPFKAVTQLSESFTAVLLAGGRSRRMGRDKAELQLGAQPLWERQLETLRALQPHALWISGRSYGGLEAVPDAWPECGPLGALATVLARAETQWIAVLAVDLPCVTPEFLHGLLAEAISRRAGVIPWDGERFHPLAAVYPRAAADIAKQRVESRALALQDFVRELETRGLAERHELSSKELPLLANLNTPEDWAHFAGPA